MKAYRQDPNSPGVDYWSHLIIEMLRTAHDYSRGSSIDPDVETQEKQLQYFRDYCEAHPTEDFGAALIALEKHLVVLTAAARALPQAPAKPVADFEAPLDVRAVVMNWRSPSEWRDMPPEHEFLMKSRIARDKTGKAGIVPDSIMLAFNDTGVTFPDYGFDPKVLAVEFQRQAASDKPPSGDDDAVAKSGVSTFFVGAQGRDVWEIGNIKGVISIRLVSKDSAGPWEAFQSDPSKYVYYGQHILNGRTAAMTFADRKVERLATAACVGDKSAIAQALKDGADPNAKGEEGRSPLIWALDCGNIDGVEALLKAGSDPNYRQEGTSYDEVSPPTHFILDRFSATYIAAAKHNVPALNLLLQHGGDPNTYLDDKPGESALIEVWRHRNRDELKVALDADKDISRPIPYDESLAAMAAKAGDFETVEDVLKRGYSYELRELARLVQNYDRRTRFTPLSPERDAARQRVMALLQIRGIVFPILDYIRIGLTTDGMWVMWGNVTSWHGFTPTGERQTVKRDDPLYKELLKAAGEVKPGDMGVIDPNPPETQH